MVSSTKTNSEGNGFKLEVVFTSEDMPLFWQFVTSLSPRITGSPARRQACSEPTDSDSFIEGQEVQKKYKSGNGLKARKEDD